ncbi:MAG: DUF58 domain-containing protein [Bacilli bacterium]|nr:DUF58 domain-containing protein [Bacilli bacterium]
MKYKYINAIRANILIYTNKKSSNKLDGTYKSVYRGKSMNFECLRDYTIDDEIKDIDWKASAKYRSLLVKQFVAEKKHNILFVFDTGLKMSGNTELFDDKKMVAMMTAGTIGYLAINNGDYVGLIYNKQDKIVYHPYKNNLYYLEYFLTQIDKDCCLENKEGLNRALSYLSKNLKKRSILFIITDLHGLENIDTKLLNSINTHNDVLLININDAYMHGDNLFDINNQSYIPKFVACNNHLEQVERKIRQELYEQILTKIKIDIVSINGLKEINLKVIELLERHRNASIN